ncbi:MAG: N-acetylneuraminate synthase [Planctomycetota bacterium]
MRIGDRAIGSGEPAFIIAEIGVNHNGNARTAVDMVRVAAEAGADAVKLQTFRAEALVTADAPKAQYQRRETGAGTQGQMLRTLELDEAGHRAVLHACREHRVVFLSTPFDESSADMLVSLGVPAIKIGSGDITHTPLIEHCARTGLPLIISTGMSDTDEVARAVEAARAAGCADVALLHCVSSYPAPPDQANLRAISAMRDRFGVPVGWSDHSEIQPNPALTAVAAVALGAGIFERHFTLDRALPGPDHAASLEPGELAGYVAAIRRTEAALGDGAKRCMPCEADTRQVARRSLVARRDIEAGEVITAEMLDARRPGTGIAPTHTDKIVGRVARDRIEAGTLVQLDHARERVGLSADTPDTRHATA